MAALKVCPPLVALIISSIFFALSSSSAGELEVPKPNLSIQEFGKSAWIVIGAHGQSQADGQTSHWRLDECLSTKLDYSYSWHQYDRADEGGQSEKSFELLSKSGRLFHGHLDDGVCQLDRRQDHWTLFPWRYTGYLSPTGVVGLMAVWLNAIHATAKCKYTDEHENEMICSWSEDQPAKLELELHLEASLSGDDRSQAPTWRPVYVRVHRSLAFLTDQTHSVTDGILVELWVDKLDLQRGEQAQSELAGRMEAMSKLCAEQVHYKTYQFPSLARELAESRHRSYQFHYVLRQFTANQQDSTELKESRFSISEQFSYEFEALAVEIRKLPEALGDSYKRLFRLRGQSGGPLSVKVRRSKSGQPTECYQENFDSFYHAISPLLEKKMLLQGKHPGYLLGLGALLLNLADQDIQGGRLRRSNEYISSTVWMADDDGSTADTEGEVRLHFRRNAFGGNHDCEISDLMRVEFRRRKDNFIVATLNLLDYSIALNTHELTSALALPPICHVEEIENTQTEPHDSEIDSQPNFPLLEILTGLEENYVLTSIWQLQTSDAVSLKEYFMLDQSSDTHDVDEDSGASTLGRLDVQRENMDSRTEDFRLYGRRSSGKLVRYEISGCKLVDKAPDWLSFAAAKTDEQQQQEQWDAPGLSLLGLAGLLRQSSQSRSVEYLGISEGQHRSHRWVLKDIPEMPGVSAEFTFEMVTGKPFDGASQVLKSVKVDAPNLAAFKSASQVNIHSIELKLNGAHAGHFVLPPNCDPKFEQIIRPPNAEFVSFVAAMGSAPNSADFELVYSLSLMLPDGKQVKADMLEVNQPSRGSTGQVQFTSEHRKWTLWPLSELETLVEIPMFNRHMCKLTGSLAETMRLHSLLRLLHTSVGSDEGQIKFPLAQLWHLAGELIAKMKGKRKDDQPGARKFEVSANQVHRTRLGENVRMLEWTLTGDDSDTIVFTFQHSHTAEALLLYSVQFRPREISVDQEAPVQMEFFVKKISRQALDVMQFAPSDECVQYARQNKIPTLAQQIRGLSADEWLIELRAEKTVSSVPDGSGKTSNPEVSLIDEWAKLTSSSQMDIYRHTQVASVLNYVSTKKDLLLLASTEEVFDLSKRYHCSEVGQSKLTVENWAANKLIELISENSLGPLALWWLSSKPEMQTRLLAEPLDVVELADWGLATDWLQLERWKVEFRGQSAYLMQFESGAFVQDSEKRAELVRVELSTRIDSPALVIFDISNFRLLKADAAEAVERITIPKGFGCQRNERALELHASSIGNDYLGIEPLELTSIPSRFNYESTLGVCEKTDEMSSACSSWRTLPVVQSGSFYFCPGALDGLSVGEVRVSEEYQRFFNGTLNSRRKIVHFDTDFSNQAQHRLLDQINGVCRVWRKNEVDMKQLFMLDFDQHKIPMRLQLIGNPIERNSPFQPIQVLPGPDNSVRVVYELRKSYLTLNDKLRGPASIIRTFTRFRDAKASLGHSLHSKATVEVIMPEYAHLTIGISEILYHECLDVIEAARVRDCYKSTDNLEAPELSEMAHERPYRLFELTLVSTGSAPWTDGLFQEHKTIAEKRLAHVLLDKPIQMRPFQLGQIHLDHRKSDSTIIAHLNLIESPTAIELFSEHSGRAFGAQTGPLYRLLPSKFACSSWCDSIRDCVALSYCKDRTCRVVEKSIITKIEAQLSPKDAQPAGKEDPSARLARLLGEKSDSSCTVYRSLDAQPRKTLRKPIEMLHRLAGGRDIQDSLMMKFFGRDEKNKSWTSVLRAVKLVEIYENTFSSLELDTPDETSSASAIVYTVYRLASKFDMVDLTTIKGVNIELVRASSRADCTQACARAECQLGSYCTSDQICILVSKLTHWQMFKQTLDQTRQSQSDCQIFGEDFSLAYHHFDGTRRPEQEIERVEGLSLSECAALCQLGQNTANPSDANKLDCLSFDFCISQTDKTSSCHLQSLHVMMEDFDESIMSKQSEKTTATNSNDLQPLCSHYSKSLLYDYRQVLGTKFGQHGTLVLSYIRVDACALMCRRDETCVALEFCDHSGARTCYIERRRDNTDDQNVNHADAAELPDQARELVAEDGCRVLYLNERASVDLKAKRLVPKQWPPQSLVPDTQEPLVPLEPPGWLTAITHGRYWMVFEAFFFAGCLFGAMVLGAIAHITIVVVTGHRLPWLAGGSGM